MHLSNKGAMHELEIQVLRGGGVGVLLTDTLYGLVGSARSKKAVRKIYRIKGRNNKKPLIILISSIKDLKLFGIEYDGKTEKILKKFWPGPVSIIMPCVQKKFEYLHRGTQTLAFRFPAKKALIEILKHTGPLVAPSANPEGLPPANTIQEAKKYFGGKVDFYGREGVPKTRPSKIITIIDNKVQIVRK